MKATSPGRFFRLAVFAPAAAALFVIISVFPYEYRDSDSSCYSSLSQKLARRPYGEWCAPQWDGHGGNEGLFFEHPPGIFWLPALFIQAGVKADRAALWANFVYLLSSLFLIFKLAERRGDSLLGWGAVWGVILTPAFLQYLIRASQEPPLALAVLAGIYGLVRLRDSRWGGWLFAAALVSAVMIKGVSAVWLSLPAGLFWLLAARNRKTFSWIAAGHLIALAAAALFEVWFRETTQLGFWSSYFAVQGGRSLGGAFRPLHAAYNFAWYAARILWFAAPWTFLLIYDGAASLRKKRPFPRDGFARFLLLSVLIAAVLFSLSDRKADRYIFPAYPLTALAGLLVFFKVRPKAADYLAKGERWFPAAFSLALVVLTFLRIFFHSHLYRYVRIWPQ